MLRDQASTLDTATRVRHFAPSHAYPWTPDCGDGTYQNPILCADYSDPDVVRVGQDFFLVSSSFNCTPGLPVLHSRDLVNWVIAGHALKNLPDRRYNEVHAGCGVWAPSIRFHAGKFWIFYATPDEGIFFLTSAEPHKGWSEPRLLQAGKGLIDPCALWDDDGRAYLVHAYAMSRAGIRDMVRVRPMAPDGSKLLGEGQIVFHVPERHPILEGPKFLKRNGWYYIIAPAGGIETGWQVALRSRNIFGPYEDKVVLCQGDSEVNGPHQGGLVDTPKGEWWFLHFQDAGLYGRLVHLQPVDWQDDWPVMGKNGEPVIRHRKPTCSTESVIAVPQTSDEFNDTNLGLQWQWNANHTEDWLSLSCRPGWLRLYPQLATPDISMQPSLLLQKFPARTFTAEALLEFFPLQSGEETGIAIIGEKSATLGIEHDGIQNRIIFRTRNHRRILFEDFKDSITLSVEVSDGGACTFSFRDSSMTRLCPLTFQAHKGAYIGAKVGLYSVKRIANAPSGHVDIDWFRFR